MRNPLDLFGRIGLYLTVFITGAAVMVIELLGTRLIAPFYGASLYVWSSLISVTMIALALGYFTGGFWADRAMRSGLALVIAIAGVLTLLIPWLTRPVLLATDPLGLRAGAFVSALVLFLPSLTMLGMVGPFAIKRATAKLDGIGSSVGAMYAVSTLGSVAGTLLLGFFIFPLFGSREILIGQGVLLLLVALPLALYEQRTLGLKVAVLPCITLAIIATVLLPKIAGAGYAGGNDSTFKIIAERESLYGKVKVVDQPARDLRLLMSDASTIGAASISNGENRLIYQDIVSVLPALAPGMKRALLIGQGAGHMAMSLEKRYNVITDTLEIDPAVADAAVQYFGFVPNGEAKVGDGRYEIRRLKGPYDLIILDCFTGGAEPAHLLTTETLSQLQRLLSERGILALNFVAFGENGRNSALASVAQTISHVFAHYTTFISEPGEDFNDFIFLASAQPISTDAVGLNAEQSAWLKRRIYPIDVSIGTVLTDNYNPLEHLQLHKAEYYRHMQMSWFGAGLLVR